MIRDRLQEALGRRRRGAVAVLAVAAMIPVTGMMAASMNGGQMIDDRRHAQDASDALAIMHGTWAARSLNVMSMNNVAATQLMTVAIGSEALQGTLYELQITAGFALAHISGHMGRECRSGFPYDPWPGICIPWHLGVMAPATLAIIKAQNIRNEFDPGDGIDVSSKVLEAIEGMNEAIVARFPRAMAEIGAEYADVLDFDDFHFADPCDGAGPENCAIGQTRDGMALPVEEGGLEARAEFCAAMKTGTTIRNTTFYSRSFPVRRGPLDHGGSNQNPVARDHINEETEVNDVLHDFKEYYDDDTPVIGSALPTYWFTGGFTSHPDWANLQGDQEADGPNSFTRRFDSMSLSVCTGIHIPIPLAAMTIDTSDFTFWRPTELPTLVPRPARADAMPDEYRVLAFSLKEKSKRLAAQILADDVKAHFGYAQAGLYNPDGADLFSQNWRQTLMGASRMDEPGEVSQGLGDRAPTGFTPLAQSLEAVQDLASWRRINAH